MATGAEGILFRKEVIQAAEKNKSVIEQSVTTEFISEGGDRVTFLVTGSGGNLAKKRASNGQIIYNSLVNNQHTAILEEYIAGIEIESKGATDAQDGVDSRRQMMVNAVTGAINRTKENVLLTELNNATLNMGPITFANLNDVAKAASTIASNNFGVGGMAAVISPAVFFKLIKLTEFTSADFGARRLNEVRSLLSDNETVDFNWFGFNWYVTTGILGATNAQQVVFYHKNAVGLATNMQDMGSVIYKYDEKQRSYYANAAIKIGAKILQSKGVIKATFDATTMIQT